MHPSAPAPLPSLTTESPTTAVRSRSRAETARRLACAGLLAAGAVAGVVGQMVFASALLLVAPVLWPHLVDESRATARPVVRLAWSVVGTSAALIVAGTLDEAAGPARPSAWRQLAEIHADLVMTVLGLALAVVFALAAVDASRRARRLAGELLAALLAQGALGYASYFAGAARTWALAHMVGALVVWTAVLRLQRELVPRRRSVPARED